MNDFIRSAILVLAFCGLILSTAADCPKKCKCKAQDVSCKGQGLTSIPSLPVDCKTVDLSDNKITEIRDTDLKNLTKLTTLSLTSNLIKSVDAKVFNSNVALANLYLGGNNLTQVPDMNLKSLVSVDFSGNAISQVPVQVFGKSWSACKSLTSISLARNKFENFPSTTFSNLHGLPIKTLDMSGNSNLRQNTPIDPSVFKRISGKLESLDLSSNALTLAALSPPLHFTGQALTTLNLRGNRLKTLDDTLLQNLTHLKTLDLSGNQLAEWTPKAFSRVKLTNLDLSNNQLETVRPNASMNNNLVHIEKSLKILKLSGNPFSCYCSLVWLRKWIDTKTINVTDKANMNCSQPEEMKGAPVLSLNAKNCTSETMTTTVKPNTTTTEAPTTTTPLHNMTTTAPPHNQTTTVPYNGTTTAPYNGTTTAPYNGTTTAPYNGTTTIIPGNMTTTSPNTTASPGGKKKGFPWWGVVLILLLIGAVIGVGYLLFKRWRRNRMLDEGRLPIIGDQTA